MWVIGNWKMHKTRSQAQLYLQELKRELEELKPDQKVALAVPFTLLSDCATRCGPFWIGAQNIHESSEGAFTGEISIEMVLDAGARFVLVGHSERRHLFGESQERIALKLQRALGLAHAVLCVGETAVEREQGLTRRVLEEQLTTALSGVAPQLWTRLLVAYEPVWAVGSGRADSVSDISHHYQLLRRCLETLAPGFGSRVPILYGGSVQPESARAIVPYVDGVLVGGACLDPELFAAVAKVCFTCQR